MSESKLRRCRNCHKATLTVDEKYVFCEEHRFKVFGDSLPCMEYDDTEVF